MNKAVPVPQVLVVDDDPALVQVLSAHIRSQGMHAHVARSGGEMVQAITTSAPHLVVLDLHIGQDNGLDLLRDLRRHSDLPVIIITGHRRDEIDRVVGLELGADDYLPKPFGLHELTARIRAVLRRHASVAVSAAAAPLYRFGGWRLDTENRCLTDPQDAPVQLTKGEYALLLAFLEAPQRPLSRDQLMQATRLHEDVFDRSIDVQILRLRRKLEEDHSAPRIIVTRRGVGYVFDLPVERA